MENFEKVCRKSSNRYGMDEGQKKGRKLNKTQRGGGVKGAFRGAEGKDSLINQEKYFAGA